MKGNIILEVIVFINFLALSNQACYTCTTISYCAECYTGVCTNCCNYYSLDSNGVCTRCQDGKCLKCNKTSTSQVCTICEVWYAKDPSNNSACIPVDSSTERNCLAVNDCNLTSCLDGNVFALNSANQCLKCNQIFRNCLKCNNTHCHQCQSNFARNITSGYKQCQICNIPRCSYCQDGPKCKNCLAGSYLSGDICLTCSLPCKTCTSATACTQCDASQQLYVLVNSTCLPCRVSINNCYKCIAGNLTCTLCMEGYFLNSTTSACEQCNQTCKTCSIASDNCTACFGIGRVLVSNVCKLCSEQIADCDNCSSTTTCLKCKDGFALTSSNTICQACSPLHGGCSICDNSKCYVCNTGFTLQSDFKCTMDLCDSPCLLCSLNSTTCVSCVIGYHLVGTSCLSCNQTCRSCSNSSSCITCADEHVFNGGSCTVCPAGKMYNPFTYTCSLCDISCTVCRWWEGCSICSPLYQLDSTIKPAVCLDICGDGFVQTLECDNDIGVAHDGCLDDCKIQKDFTCTTTSLNANLGNGSIVPTGQSDCIYTGSISMKIIQARQSLFKNTLTIGFQIKPYLFGMPTNADTQLQLQAIFKLTPLSPQVKYTVSVDILKEVVSIQIDHSIDISLTYFTFTVDFPTLAASDNMFSNLPQQSINFVPQLLSPFGRLGQFQSQQDLQKSNMIYYWSTFLSISGLVICVFGIFGKVLVGLDQVMLMQTFFIMIAFADKQLPLSLQALSGLKYSTGLQFSSNSQKFSQAQSYTVQIQTDYFITNFNFNLIAYLLPLLGALIFLIYMLKNKHLPSIKEVARQNYEVLIGESIFYITAFNFNGLIVYSYLFYTYSPYSNDFYSNLAVFFAAVFTIYAFFNYFFKSYVVGMFRSAFRSESQQRDTSKYECVQKYTQCISRRFFNDKLKSVYIVLGVNFYTIYLTYMIISLSLLIWLPSISSAVILVMQVIILFLVAFIRPHYSIYEKLRAIITWSIALFGTIVIIIASNSFFLSMLLMSFLSFHILVSILVMIISVWQQVRRKCNDRTQAVRKLLKQEDTQNEKNVLRQIILRYQQLQNPTISLTVDNEVHKLQQFYSKNDSSKKINLLDKEQPIKDASRIPEHLKFQNQIIKQQHDHWRYQKGLEFFDKYQGIIDNDLVKQEYANIQQFQEQQQEI